MRRSSRKPCRDHLRSAAFFAQRIMLKKYFSAGLLLWVPLEITLWVLESLIRWSDVVLNLLPPELINKGV